ncbi:MAG: 16S rRNA (guanine(527)-N(7))-methyltransferase RsmG [Chloroflexi bacterium]|nr:16S rRNA (guanine(527)-N(7))-methyltransferase RsmG [Chloroflexota bacterium]MBI4267677.1 16S rRNA (guanine(527)-N(7))-methyltransferase RsmG [Chloroflexota bacterium]
MEKLNAGAAKLGMRLSERQLEQFSVYYEELIEWNRRYNLTAITGYEEVQFKHFLDSLTVITGLRPEIVSSYPCVIDIGTGAGFPGIPLKIVFPTVHLVLLEATLKKITFLYHLIEKLGLDDVEIVAGRAEEMAHSDKYRGKFDVALSRAVAPLATLVELALPFCAIGGRFIAQKKGDIEPEVSRAASAISVLGGSLREIKTIELEELSDKRYLVIIDKVSSTPTHYPRRAGMPAKRPII